METDHYFAFISYSRKDAAFAREIQYFLEHYKYPRSVVPPENQPEDEQYIRRVFLDTDDLSTRSPDFMAELEEKLKNSRYLLVLCSTNSAASKSVCHWEIRTFLKYHSMDDILPIALNGVEAGSIPEEVMPIVARRNIVLLDSAASMKSFENRGMLFHVAEFLLKVDAILLNNRYEKERRAAKRKQLTLAMIVLTLISILSTCLAIECYYATIRAREHTRFEQKVFPSSIVFGYAKNFLVPLIKATTAAGTEKCIMVIAMPRDYSELPNRAEVKREHFSRDASSLGWRYENVKIEVAGRRPIAIGEISPGQPVAGARVFADMASTVTAIKHVVDYLTTTGNSKFHANTMEEKERLTAHYLREFKTVLMDVLRVEKELGSPEVGNYQIYFVANHEELRATLDEIQANAQK